MKASEMKPTHSVVAVFADHPEAEAALKLLTSAGFEIKDLSIVGKGYHTEEKAVGFYNVGDRMRVWGSRGAFWGGLWGFFFGGIFLAIPVVGHVLVLGYLATAVISAVEGALAFGGLSALGAALTTLGVPKDSVIHYETAIKADGFLVMAHGSVQDMSRARHILAAAHPTRLDLHAAEASSEAHLIRAES
jgi:hypothetical protein